MAKTDREMMFDSDSWPQWPHLPLKKKSPLGQLPELAILVELDDESFAFYPDGKWEKRLGRLELATEAKYGGKELIEELLQDGWHVD